MGTRALIGALIGNQTFVATYLAADAYPEVVVPALWRARRLHGSARLLDLILAHNWSRLAPRTYTGEPVDHTTAMQPDDFGVPFTHQVGSPSWLSRLDGRAPHPYLYLFHEDARLLLVFDRQAQYSRAMDATTPVVVGGRYRLLGSVRWDLPFGAPDSITWSGDLPEWVRS